MSSKLIHGGLRYLEHYEFRLVHEALKEREILLRMAPHLIRPQKFILPHDQSQRPFWLVRAGLWLYDHLYFSKTLPNTQTIYFNHDDPNEILHKQLKKDFVTMIVQRMMHA